VERSERPALGIPIGDPMALKVEADRIVERAAADLRARLQQAVARRQPFPPFPGAFFTNAIEAEPDGATRADRGCIVICEDGELYELRIGVDLESLALGGFEDPVSLRKEELIPIDLHPRDYIVYAYNALTAVVERLMEQASEAVNEGALPEANRDLP
jgi:hypothetical protein